jgi:hypothetical protein
MRTAIRNDPRSSASRWKLAAGMFVLAATHTACADPPLQLADLQRDHERCLASEENRRGEVRYADYQACMIGRGWSDPDLAQRG